MGIFSKPKPEPPPEDVKKPEPPPEDVKKPEPEKLDNDPARHLKQ
jgi:hypothetical protein